MTRNDFAIGRSFWTATGEWRCTDVGTRIVAAIKLDRDDPRWYIGPPYKVVEELFDEYAVEGCAPSREAWESEFGPMVSTP